MKPGPKPISPRTKRARGTWKRQRDGTSIDISIKRDPPVMPDYLDARAVAVWEENLDRVMAGGASEHDSDLLGRYCVLEAAVRKTAEGDHMPPIAAFTELRRMGELLGIAGPKSRVQKAPTISENNPFANLDRQ